MISSNESDWFLAKSKAREALHKKELMGMVNFLTLLEGGKLKPNILSFVERNISNLVILEIQRFGCTSYGTVQLLIYTLEHKWSVSFTVTKEIGT